MKTLTNYKPHVEVTSDIEELSMRGLDCFVSHAKKAIEERGKFFVAISGGYTPRSFLEQLGDHPDSQNLDWKKIHVFWVDERCVPEDSKWSNYNLAHETFLSKVNIPHQNIHAISTKFSDFEEAARQYEEDLRSIFQIKNDQLPEFDLIFLGMGSDGHTGSLMPNSYASIDISHLACVVYVMDEKLNRITLTYPVLRAASKLVVMVSGKKKAKVLKEVLTCEPDEIKYPIHLLWPVLEKVSWLVDADAAELL